MTNLAESKRPRPIKRPIESENLIGRFDKPEANAKSNRTSVGCTSFKKLIRAERGKKIGFGYKNDESKMANTYDFGGPVRSGVCTRDSDGKSTQNVPVNSK